MVPEQTVLPETPSRNLSLPGWLSWAAVVAIIALGGWYGSGVYRDNLQTQTIQSWLQDAQQVKPIVQSDQTEVAKVAFRQNRALVIMNQKAQSQKSYQVWGIKAGQPVSLGVIASRTFEVDPSGYEAIAVSLEPYGGSQTPTEVLGAVPVS